MRIIILIVFTVFAISGCRTNEKPAMSNPKWGFRNDFLGPHTLIRQPHNAKITVCGPHADMIIEAIETWANAADRKLNLSEDCTRPHIRSYGPGEIFSQAGCTKWNLWGRYYTEPQFHPMRIVDCGFQGNLKAMILHEVGHLWGLCDQYPEQIGKCDYTTAPRIGSVMSSSTTEYLTDDDITGIRYLASYFRQE